MSNLTLEQRPARHVWILYVNDGDSDIGDPSESAILECEGSGSIHALRKMLSFWRGHDAVLYQYDEGKGKELVNECMIGQLSEGTHALMEKCK